MITILDSKQKGERTYYLADTDMGQIIFYHFSGMTQWKNLTNHDILWSIKPTEEFERIHKSKPVETFLSKRKDKFLGDKVKVKCDDHTYWLAEMKKSDGYLYEIPATDLRVFNRQKYPNMQFPYTRYRIDAVREMDYGMLERLKTEEVVRHNGDFIHSVYVVSSICEAVYNYCKRGKIV